jgi:putative NADH-flavin reductase
VNKLPEIAVLGGTGKAGKYVVEELIRQGYPVKMLVRNPDISGLKNPIIELVKGNARNYEAIQRLLTGCSAVVSTLGNSRIETDTCSTAIEHIIRLTEKMNIKRYIEVAGLGIDTPSDKKGFRTRLIVKLIKTFFPKPLQDRQKGYVMLYGSKLNWTIIRCPSIEMTSERRSLKVSIDDSPGTRVSAADLADFIVRQLTVDQYVRKCPFVAS